MIYYDGEPIKAGSLVQLSACEQGIFPPFGRGHSAFGEEHTSF
jgi:hypothetical protein